MNRRVWVEVNLKTLVANYRKIAAKAKPAKVLCVLKANAYGLGVGAYAKALAGAGCKAFGVAEPFEALELLKVFSSSPFPVPHSPFPSVQILSSILPDEIAPMVKAGVILPITDLATAKLISAAAVKAKVTAKVHFKLDTGMGRLGIIADCEERIPATIELMREVKALPNLDCEGVFSHFPMAYDPSDPFTKKQIALFKKVVAAAKKAGIGFKKIHIAASDAINIFPECA